MVEEDGFGLGGGGMTSKINKVTHIKKTTNCSIYIYFITGISNASFHRLTVVHCEAETSDSGGESEGGGGVKISHIRES